MATRREPVRRPRRSACMERSRELERQRIEQLSVEERIVLALSLGERLAVLPTMPGRRGHDGAGCESDRRG
ncbi:MAG: hypothetical protein KGQ61_11795 [Planctomycetes bacterium]|nr:hypothetical protein [Planctomycetota bacterium]